jgi:hypothetical protein
MVVVGTGIVASIGRNVGEVPLPSDRWSSFKADVLAATARAGAVVFSGTGQGVYEDVEEAFTVIVTTTSDVDLVAVVADLALAATKYEQEAIALTVGRTLFVPGSLRLTGGQATRSPAA